MTQHTPSVNQEYISRDHAFRTRDSYALAKYALTIRWLRPYLKPGAVVFNIGCGVGYFNTALRRFGVSVVACEPDPQAYALANDVADEHTTVMCGDLAQFAATMPGQADIVVMHDVLEHIADDDSAARILWSLLKPEARVVLSVPALQYLFGKHDQEWGHYRRYSKRRLRQVLQPFFTISRLQYYGMASIPIVLVFSKWLRTPYPMGAASGGLIHRLYDALCQLETHIAEPIGTSLICELRARTDVAPVGSR